MRSPLAVALAVVAAAGALAGCSSGSSGAPAAASSLASRAGDVTWNPCDGLTPAQVSRIAGTAMTEQTGTADQPRCTFTPVRKGGPAYDVSYLFFDGGLDAALASMGAAGRQLRPVEVPGADAARVAVKPRPSGILVTGFVQTGGVVQSVNAAQLAPYDQEQLVSSTTALLAALAKAAPQG
ncbi:DUF3558 family protein [Nocardioides sp.]|uniref:DUF3558 family protein n=1 Tax=Nocardioides sp. TaxID=35761 RepID=UPI003784BDE2